MTISRAELDELFREDDRARIEHRQWMAEREALASTYMQRNDDGAGLLFRTTDNALVHAPAPQAEVFDDDLLGYAVNKFAEAVEHRFDDDDRRFAALKTEVAELRGQVSALLTVLGQKEFKAAGIVDLPNWRRDAA